MAVAAVAAGLALYLWNPKPVQRLELGTVDARFAVRGPRAADPRLVLVAVNDRTLARRGSAGERRLPRDDWARMLTRLGADRPAVIALDVIFQDPAEPRADAALVDAIRAARDRLVLPFANFEVVDEIGGRAVRAKLFGGVRVAQATGVRTGFAGLPSDGDGRNRRADYVVDATPGGGGRGYSGTSEAKVSMPTFAFAAARLVRGGSLPAEDFARRRATDGQSERTTWIDFRGPPGTIRRVSAADVLDRRVRPGAFRDKLVVVGVTASRVPDVHRTPLDGGRAMPGPEVQANALDTILRGAPLRDVPPLLDILAIVLLAAVPAAASLAGSLRFAVAVPAAALLFLVAVQLAFGAGRIVAVVTPLVALLVAAVGAASLAGARTRRARQRAGTRGEAGPTAVAGDAEAPRPTPA
jgi:adenylate cyclase